MELGKFLHEINYPRDKKEVEYGSTKFDVVRKRDNKIVIIENKKSLKFEEASKYQLAYYLYTLKLSNINAIGYLVCPSEKKKILIELDEEMENNIKNQALEIEKIIEKDKPNEVKRCKYCTKCGYNNYCFS